MSLKRKAQKLFFLDPAGVAAVLRSRLASREWWTFLIVHGLGVDFLADLERRFYPRMASGDFEILVIPHVPGLGPVGVALAKKSRLSVRELARHLDQEGMTHEAETLAKHGNDIIILAHSAEVLHRVQSWLLGLVRGEAVGAT